MIPHTLDDSSLARMIDHTLLRPEATLPHVAKLCDEAIQYGFASVCVNPSFVPYCAEKLRGSPVKVCTVIGFPLGASSTKTKVYEASLAIDEGAEELDIMMNIGQLKSGNDENVIHDLRSVIETARSRGVLTKAIIEASLLTDPEKKRACQLAMEAGADFVKTSTGFSNGGATREDVRLMREIVGPLMGVKASGGIRTRREACALIDVGATRIGASTSVQIITQHDDSPSAEHL